MSSESIIFLLFKFEKCVFGVISIFVITRSEKCDSFEHDANTDDILR